MQDAYYGIDYVLKNMLLFLQKYENASLEELEDAFKKLGIEGIVEDIDLALKELKSTLPKSIINKFNR